MLLPIVLVLHTILYMCAPREPTQCNSELSERTPAFGLFYWPAPLPARGWGGTGEGELRARNMPSPRICMCYISSEKNEFPYKMQMPIYNNWICEITRKRSARTTPMQPCAISKFIGHAGIAKLQRDPGCEKHMFLKHVPVVFPGVVALRSVFVMEALATLLTGKYHNNMAVRIRFLQDTRVNVRQAHLVAVIKPWEIALPPRLVTITSLSGPGCKPSQQGRNY